MKEENYRFEIFPHRVNIFGIYPGELDIREFIRECCSGSWSLVKAPWWHPYDKFLTFELEGDAVGFITWYAAAKQELTTSNETVMRIHMKGRFP